MNTDLNGGSGMIFKQLALVMKDVGAVGKNQRNSAQGYAFRGIDDIYNAVQPVFAKHGVVMVPYLRSHIQTERPSKSGGTLISTIVEMEYKLYAEDGSFILIKTVGEGMDSGDKSTNKAMASAAKYALMQGLCLATEEYKDSEHDNHEVAPVQLVSPAEMKTLLALGLSNGWPEDKVLNYIFTNFEKYGVKKGLVAKTFTPTMLEQTKKAIEESVYQTA